MLVVCAMLRLLVQTQHILASIAYCKTFYDSSYCYFYNYKCRRSVVHGARFSKVPKIFFRFSSENLEPWELLRIVPLVTHLWQTYGFCCHTWCPATIAQCCKKSPSSYVSTSWVLEWKSVWCEMPSFYTFQTYFVWQEYISVLVSEAERLPRSLHQAGFCQTAVANTSKMKFGCCRDHMAAM